MPSASAITMPSHDRKRSASAGGDISSGPRQPHRHGEFDRDLTAYLDEIGRRPLLSAEREIELAKEIQRDKRKLERLLLRSGRRGPQAAPRRSGRGRGPGEAMLHRLSRESQRIPAPDRAREAMIWLGRLMRAREELIVGNLRLVVHVAKPYASRGIALADLIQEGNVGLIRAAEKFDHQHGTKFSTYAHWWIRQAVQRAVAEKGDTVRVPIRVGELRRRVAEAVAELGQRYGRRPTGDEIASAIGVSARKVEELMSVPTETQSIDDDPGKSMSAIDRSLQSSVPPQPMRSYERTELRGLIAQLLVRLNPREAEILRLRYGLEERERRTLEEVGNLLGLSRERVRQIQSSALAKLRDPAGRKGLEPYAG